MPPVWRHLSNAHARIWTPFHNQGRRSKRAEQGEDETERRLGGGANSKGRDSASVTHVRLSWRAGGSRTAGHPMGDDAACVAMVTGLCPRRL